MRGIRRSLGLFTILASMTAFPGFAAECGPLLMMTSVPMRPIAGGPPGIDVLIADIHQTLLVDTGGVLSSVTKRTMRELNLKPTQSNVTMSNVRGQKSGEAVRLPSLAIGSLRQEGAYFQIDPAADNPNDKNPQPYGGTLGPDLLQRFDADFDFANGSLNLVSPDHCKGKAVYWTAPAVAVVPIRVAQFGHVFFPMTLDGKRVAARLDTGSTDSVINLDVARRVFNVNVNAPDVQIAGEIIDGYTANVYRRRFKKLELDGVVISDPLITLRPVGPPPTPPASSFFWENDDLQGLPDMILGMSVLSKLHVYIAYKERKLYVSSGGTSPAP